jgi:putative hydrolase
MTRSAPRFGRFRDLDHEALNVDCQVHTTWSDGRADVRAMLEAARERRLAAIALTEHVRRDTAWFCDFAGTVRAEARAVPGMDVYVGCEAKALDADGTLDVTDEIRAQCDLVLGVVHRFPDGRGGFLDFKRLDWQACAELEWQLTRGLLRAAPIDVLGHPGGMTQRWFGRYPASLFRKILEASGERGIAVEINSAYVADWNGFLALCEEVNPVVSIGSDAHGPDELGRCRDRLRRWARFA